jgi:RimJ/RimL family protein N-acetyltransferase
MITIRFAKPNELKIVRKMYVKGFEKYGKTEIFHYFLDFLTKDRIKQKEILLAFDGKKPVGMCSFLYHPQIFFKSIYLENGAIIKSYQRTGVGTALVKRVLQLAKAKGARRIFSDTWPGNEASINFHKKLGFKYSGKIVNAQDEKHDYIFFSRKP